MISFYCFQPSIFFFNIFFLYFFNIFFSPIGCRKPRSATQNYYLRNNFFEEAGRACTRYAALASQWTINFDGHCNSWARSFSLGTVYCSRPSLPLDTPLPVKQTLSTGRGGEGRAVNPSVMAGGGEGSIIGENVEN